MKTRLVWNTLAAFAALSLCAHASAQQVADPLADLSVAHPAFTATHPHVVIDAAHHNFHTVDGRYAPFAQVLRNDGMVVDGSNAPFTDASLRGVDILVIANPLAAVNAPANWKLPTPSAFTPDEIAAVRRFVENGGALFLIVDHMPFAGAAHDLAAAFGVEFENGFAFSSPANSPQQPDIFSRENGGLADDPAFANVRSVRTFTGSASAASGAGVHPILRLSHRWTIYKPQVAWAFDAHTPTLPGDNLLQGALIEFGRGRIAVFGEAAMFTAQVAGPQQVPMGLRAPGAEENKQFELDLVNWLARAPAP
jgi:hypothetical protein